MWYSILKTEQPFIFSIKGEVQGIEKTAEGATEVLVQEDASQGDDGVVGYQLDDNLVRAETVDRARKGRRRPSCCDVHAAANIQCAEMPGEPGAWTLALWQASMRSRESLRTGCSRPGA